ncbi:MAG: hypothetical protein EOO20_02785 [Chryseobacterium sp.]|nr:MAG: hypothetical protein EOO20_02785 [Chryseobacterium sp.]
MKICQCCRTNPANKTNTHYLTDGIIRNCLNELGSNKREKGAMFDISSSKTSIEFAFQRSTSQRAIIEGLGHEPSEKEIEEAKHNAFSVDYVFCSACEEKFGEIERPFMEEILPKFRDKDMSGTTELVLVENIVIRKFFLLQIFRTSIAENEYWISEELENKLRSMIMDESADNTQILSIPLNISYLNTAGGDFDYTRNTVGIAYLENHKIILFNDFLIQFFEKPSEIIYVDFFRVNDKASVSYFTNFNEESFRFKVFDPIKREEVLANYLKFKVRQMLEFYVQDFQEAFFHKRGFLPSRHELSVFITEIINGNRFQEFQRYSHARYEKIKAQYI